MLLSEARPRPWRESNPLKRGFNQEETDKAAFDELKKDAQFTLDYKKNGEYGRYTRNSKSAYNSAAAEKFQAAIPQIIELLQNRLPKSSVAKYVKDISDGKSRICISLVNSHYSHKVDPKLRDSLPYKQVRHTFTQADYNEETGTFDVTGTDNIVWVDNEFVFDVLKQKGISTKEFVQFNENQLEEFILDDLYPAIKRAIASEIEYFDGEVSAPNTINSFLRRAGRRKSGKGLEPWDARLMSMEGGYYQ